MSDSFVNSFFQAPDNKKESRKGLSVRMILFTQTGYQSTNPMIPFRTNLMFLVVIFFIILFSRKSFIFRHTSFSIFFLNLSPSIAEDPSENKEENPSCHSHYQYQLT